MRVNGKEYLIPKAPYISDRIAISRSKETLIEFLNPEGKVLYDSLRLFKSDEAISFHLIGAEAYYVEDLNEPVFPNTVVARKTGGSFSQQFPLKTNYALTVGNFIFDSLNFKTGNLYT